MAKVRMLSHMAETAGCREADIDAQSVGELLDRLTARFGADFARKLKSCKVLVNGAGVAGFRLGRIPLKPSDEVSLLPPIAGG